MYMLLLNFNFVSYRSAVYRKDRGSIGWSEAARGRRSRSIGWHVRRRRRLGGTSWKSSTSVASAAAALSILLFLPSNCIYIQQTAVSMLNHREQLFIDIKKR